jgi:site-specific recombinase XerD
MKPRRHGFRSVMGPDIEQFLAHKRALGRRYDVEEKTLALFDDYLVAHHIAGLSDVGVDLIERFLLSRPRPHPRSYNHLRCTLARLFAWLVGQGRLEQTPVQSRPRRATYQRQPFIFDTTNARRLLDLVQTLPDKGGTVQRGKTYHALLAILYGLGLRVGEVCGLRVQDVDFERRLLVIRETKFYKSRLVPFGPKIETLLKAYLQLKAKHWGSFAPNAPLFSLRGGRAINPCTVSQTFHHLLPRLSIEIPPGCSPPRLHDLRHSFAVGALLRWYRSGADPQTHLLALATFLGHVDVNSTAVYLTTTAALLEEANQRFEAFAARTLREGLHL